MHIDSQRIKGRLKIKNIENVLMYNVSLYFAVNFTKHLTLTAFFSVVLTQADTVSHQELIQPDEQTDCDYPCRLLNEDFTCPSVHTSDIYTAMIKTLLPELENLASFKTIELLWCASSIQSLVREPKHELIKQACNMACL